jgi:transglutaminase-like putative cysteine protease
MTIFRLKRNPRLAMLLSAVVLTGAWPSRASFDADGSRPAHFDRQLLADADDGRLDEHSLIGATLRAGGLISPQDLASLEGRFELLAGQMGVELQDLATAHERTVAIHRLLHERVFSEYQTDASDVAETLRSGAYNCVSASILFVELARRFGLDAHAVQLPEHVRCEVIVDGATVPVEMTSIGAPLAARAKSGRVRVLSDVELLATVYYNRGVKAFDTGDLDAAIRLNTLALELDPDCRPARANLLAAINNRVVQLVQHHEHSQASVLLEQGLRVAPAYKPFLTNRAYLRGQTP